jgi:hypothetical protein
LKKPTGFAGSRATTYSSSAMHSSMRPSPFSKDAASPTMRTLLGASSIARS